MKAEHFIDAEHQAGRDTSDHAESTFNGFQSHLVELSSRIAV
jgi:hypothetical protein